MRRAICRHRFALEKMVAVSPAAAGSHAALLAEDEWGRNIATATIA